MNDYATCVCSGQEELQDILPHGYQLPPMSLIQERRLACRGHDPEPIGEILYRSFSRPCRWDASQALELSDMDLLRLVVVCFLLASLPDAREGQWKRPIA